MEYKGLSGLSHFSILKTRWYWFKSVFRIVQTDNMFKHVDLMLENIFKMLLFVDYSVNKRNTEEQNQGK